MSPIEALPVLHDWPLTAGIMQVNGQFFNHHLQMFIYYSYISFIYIIFHLFGKSGVDALYRLQRQ